MLNILRLEVIKIQLGIRSRKIFIMAVHIFGKSIKRSALVRVCKTKCV